MRSRNTPGRFTGRTPTMADDIRTESGGYIGQSVPRREDRNLLLGQGAWDGDDAVHVEQPALLRRHGRPLSRH